MCDVLNLEDSNIKSSQFNSIYKANLFASRWPSGHTGIGSVQIFGAAPGQSCRRFYSSNFGIDTTAATRSRYEIG